MTRFRVSVRIFCGVLALLLGLALSVSALCAEGKKTSTPKPATSKTTAVPAASVTIMSENGHQVLYRVELARTGEELERGLMYRSSLPADQGMLFMFPYETVQRFWMKNTLIPLDMIFISAARKVVGVVKNAKPHDLSRQGVPVPSMYVLEVNGGEADKNGIGPGSVVEFSGFPEAKN